MSNLDPRMSNVVTFVGVGGILAIGWFGFLGSFLLPVVGKGPNAFVRPTGSVPGSGPGSEAPGEGAGVCFILLLHIFWRVSTILRRCLYIFQVVCF